MNYAQWSLLILPHKTPPTIYQHPSKYETLKQCWLNIATLGQRWANIAPMCSACCGRDKMCRRQEESQVEDDISHHPFVMRTPGCGLAARRRHRRLYEYHYYWLSMNKGCEAARFCSRAVSTSSAVAQHAGESWQTRIPAVQIPTFAWHIKRQTWAGMSWAWVCPGKKRGTQSAASYGD